VVKVNPFGRVEIGVEMVSVIVAEQLETLTGK